MQNIGLYQKFIDSEDLSKLNLKICILNDDYSNSTVPFDDNQDPRFYLPADINWNSKLVEIDKNKVSSQIKDLAKENFDLFFNLCSGKPDEDLAGVEVIYELENLNLPYVGSNAKSYMIHKKQMKQVAVMNEINTPKFYFAHSKEDIDLAIKHIKNYPMFVKHFNGYSSIGLTSNSKVKNDEELKKEANYFIDNYGGALIEEYIDGEEYGVLVIKNFKNPDEPIVLEPVKFMLPNNEEFKHFDVKFTWSSNMDAHKIKDKVLIEKLKEMGRKAFLFNELDFIGRLDIRVNKENEPFFIEINSEPGIFYTKDKLGSADLIIRNHEENYAESFIFNMMKLAWVKWQNKQKFKN